jgi:hypothetical protein
MPVDVSPTDSDFSRLTRLEIHRELAQAALHSARDADPDVAEGATEMPGVQMPMELPKPTEQPQVSRTGSFSTRRPLRGQCIGLNREVEKLPLGGSSERARDPGIQKPNDGLQHAIRRETIAPVDPEDPPAKAQHHRLVRMSQDLFDVPETERLQPFGKTVFK